MIELGIFTVQRLDKLQSNLGQSAQILKTLKKLHINGSVLKTFFALLFETHIDDDQCLTDYRLFLSI